MKIWIRKEMRCYLHFHVHVHVGLVMCWIGIGLFIRRLVINWVGLDGIGLDWMMGNGIRVRAKQYTLSVGDIFSILFLYFVCIVSIELSLTYRCFLVADFDTIIYQYYHLFIEISWKAKIPSGRYGHTSISEGKF
jgi:hypothetical protein